MTAVGVRGRASGATSEDMKMTDRDIFQRELAGESISLEDPEYPKIAAVIAQAQRVIAEMNTGYRDPAEIRALFERLTGTAVDPSFWLLPPFYTDFGRNIRVGRDVFVNHACEFMDRGGITIGDRVLIGPKVNLVTINHPLDPAARRSTYCAPIVIEDGAWLGAAVSVMPGVTIGRNAVVAANAVVTRDVPSNAVVGGIPAQVIRQIDATPAGSSPVGRDVELGAPSPTGNRRG
jgi:acetyltransferase-like isoleucine patch superfamily enzyme